MYGILTWMPNTWAFYINKLMSTIIVIMSKKPKQTLKVCLQNETEEHNDWWSLLLCWSSFCIKPLLSFSFDMACRISAKKFCFFHDAEHSGEEGVSSAGKNGEASKREALSLVVVFMLMRLLSQISGVHHGLPICPHLPFVGLHIYTVKSSTKLFQVCCLLD